MLQKLGEELSKLLNSQTGDLDKDKALKINETSNHIIRITKEIRCSEEEIDKAKDKANRPPEDHQITAHSPTKENQLRNDELTSKVKELEQQLAE